MAGTVLIVDIGTSSVKAALFDEAGRALRAADEPVRTLVPRPGFAEQDPADWWKATVATVRRLAISEPPLALTLTGSMQNIVLLDRDGAVLRPAVLYSDARIGAAEAAAARAGLPADFEQRIGNHAEPALCLFRLGWLREHEPAAMAATAKLLFGAKDAVLHRMTGRAVVDPSCASTTGLMNLAERRWDDAVLAAAGLPRALLPDILPADERAGALLDGPATELGLPAGLPVHVGAGDGGATAFGTFSEVHDQPHAYLGTTGWIAATMPLSVAGAPRDAYALAAPVGDDVIVISPFLAAGLAIDWFAAVAGRNVAELYAAAATEDAEPPDALFLPFLIGERAPFSDRAVRGAFLGLGREAKAEALAYAVLEGLAHAIRDNLDQLPIRPRSITLAGGVVESLVVARLIADVTGATVSVPGDSRLVTAYGAFRLLAPALGLAPSAESGSTIIEPRADRAGRAARRFAAYRAATSHARSLAALLG